jgi:hypothetical protein
MDNNIKYVKNQRSVSSSIQPNYNHNSKQHCIPVRITLRNQPKRFRTNHQQENEFVFHGKNNAVLKQRSHSSKSFRNRGLIKVRINNVTDFRMYRWK